MNKRKPKGYWVKEKCHEEALKYETKSDFKKYSAGAADSAFVNGWFNDICLHMNEFKKPNDFWDDKEKCQKEALKYTNKTDFKKYSCMPYDYSRRNGWLDEICSHMKIKGNLKKRFIYVYEFPDNSAYIGLTYNIEKRNNEHLTENNSTVNKHINKTSLQPILKIITEKPIEVNEASLMEGKILNEYKEKGWNILNKIKTGGIGGIIKWDYKTCKLEALKYSNKTNFRIYSKISYESARKNNWLNDFFQ